jgi:teichuronic acid biosynthesis glycosyltransferase TuaH
MDPAFASRLAPLLARPAVQWVGAQPFARLPEYLRLAAVGLVPYTHSAFNEGSFPLKTLEYLAAGVPAVTTDLPASRWLATPLVRIASGVGSFVDAVRAAIAEGTAPDARERRRRFASEHSYANRARAMLEVIDARTPTPVAGRASG